MSPVSLFIFPLFAIALMWILLNVKVAEIPPRRRYVALVLTLCVLVVDVIVFALVGRSLFAKLYPLLVHLPTLVIFCLISKYRGWPVIFVLLTAFVFCAFPPVVDSFVRLFRNTGFWDELVIFSMTCGAMLLFAKKVLQEPFSYMLRYSEGKEFAKYCIVPVFFSIYAFSQVNNYLSASDSLGLVNRILPFAFTLFFYYLMFHTFKDTREKQILQSEQDITAAQLTMAEQELEKLHTLTEQTALYRHDMRHHLTLIGGYLTDGSLDKIESYLAEVSKDLDAITPQRFCENETTNLILSSFAAKATQANVSFSVDAHIPKNLTLGNVEWCALLSNLLENALISCASVPDDYKREIRVVAKRGDDDRLLLLIKNPYSGIPHLPQGLPQTSQEGHGFGIKSVESILEKHGGISLYEAKEGLFTARIVV